MSESYNKILVKKYIYFVFSVCIFTANSSSEDLFYSREYKDGKIIYDHPVRFTDLKNEPGDFPWSYSGDGGYIWHISTKKGFEMLYSEREIEREKEVNETQCDKFDPDNFDALNLFQFSVPKNNGI